MWREAFYGQGRGSFCWFCAEMGGVRITNAGGQPYWGVLHGGTHWAGKAPDGSEEGERKSRLASYHMFSHERQREVSLPHVMEEGNEIRGSRGSCKRPVTATKGNGMGSRGDIQGKGLLSKSRSPAEDEAHKLVMEKISAIRPWSLAQTSRKNGKAASWAGLDGS